MTPTFKFTIEEIRMMAEQERAMDSGIQPYVLEMNRNRWVVCPSVMEEFGLETGQTVSDTLSLAITEAHLASLKATVALDGAK